MLADQTDAASRREFPPDAIAVRCPRCGASFSAEAVTIVDADNAVHRQALLSGRLNIASCVACGQPVGIETPLVYFDTSQEIALALLPGGMGGSREQQERTVGRLVNRVVEALPPARRKMSLLQPRMFWSSQSFMEAVLEANGISAEDLTRARGAAELVEELAKIDDVAEIERRLEQATRAADRTLPRIAEAMADDAAAQGNDAQAARLRALRDRLAQIMGPEAITLEDVLAALEQASAEGDLTGAVAGLRPVLDYSFFSELTQRIETSSSDDAKRLTALRSDILAAIDEHDALVTAELERGADSLRAVLEAPDPAEAVRRRARALDSGFFSVLQANLQAASRDNQKDLVERLEAIRETALHALEEAMPPRQRLVNRLARATSAEERRKLLDEAPDLVGSETRDALGRACAEAKAVGANDVADALQAAIEDVARRLSPPNGAGS